MLKNNRTLFNIAGNKYRLVVEINYPAQIIFVRFIGTHQIIWASPQLKRYSLTRFC
nr:type II toxin-antitoxin system HigB family toxin [Chamaesiphon sp. OTE_20_metabat_361]